ncbi:MAG: hypothetical protein IT318_12955 [Anaerolineales bacterium]|nr:hypothetical protein [Anaerolineales bacterium]
MGDFMLRVALVVVALGVVSGVLVFLTGLGRGLQSRARPSRMIVDPAARRQRAQTVRGLLLLMVVALFGGVVLGRPLMLVLALVCLGLAYWLRDR